MASGIVCVRQLAFVCVPLLSAIITRDADAVEHFTCDVPRVDGASLRGDFVEFARRFQNPVQPVLIENLIDEWPIRHWGEENFTSRLGAIQVKVRNKDTLHKYGDAGSYEQTTIADYLASVDSKGVIFENEFPEAERAVRSEYTVPELFKYAVHGKPLFSLARKGGGVGFHQHHQNWLAQVKGRKVWFFAQPDDGGRWWHYVGQNINDPCQLLQGLDAGTNVKTCVVGPSEVMFVPSSVDHATCNLDDFTLGIGWEGETYGWTPIMHAIVGGNNPALRDALKNEDPAKRMQVEVQFAVRSGNMPALKMILKRRKTRDFHAAYAWLQCAHTGRVEMMRYLLGNGAHVDTVSEGKFAVHGSAGMGHVEVLEFLLDARADVRKKDSQGSTALFYALSHGHLATTEALVSHRVSLEDEMRSSTLLFQQVANNGHVPLVEYLISRKADVNVQSNTGGRPLHGAAFGHVDVSAVLLRHRSDVHATTRDGKQAIHIASRSFAAGVIELLVQQRADILASDGRGGQPIHHAASSQQQNAVSTILRLRADPNVRDFAGLRPLHLAAQAGSLPVVQTLLESGAKPFKKGKDGLNARDVAQKAGHQTVTALLANRTCHGLSQGAALECEAAQQNYALQDIDGVLHVDTVNAQGVRDLRARGQLQPTDIVVATYPRCGTTWMQQILLALVDGTDSGSQGDPVADSPWIEVAFARHGSKAADELQLWFRSSRNTRRVFKTHAPEALPPWHSIPNTTKIVVVARNPKDAAVSHYHHSMDLNDFGYRSTGSWDHFIDKLFIPGRLVSGSFWEWHASWWHAHQERPHQILWITYEELKKNSSEGVAKVAEFIGVGANHEAVDATAEVCSFDSMKAAANRNDVAKAFAGKSVKRNHIRNGKVGSWKDVFSASQAADFDAHHQAQCVKFGLPLDAFGPG